MPADTINRQLRGSFYRRNRLAFALAAAGALMGAVLNLIISWLMQQLIDTAAGTSGALPFRILVRACGGFFLLLFCGSALVYCAKPRFLATAMEQYKNCAVTQLMQKSVPDFQRRSSAAYLSALTNDAAAIEADYLTPQFTLIQKLFCFAGALALMLTYSLPLTLAAIVLSMLPFAVSMAAGNRLSDAACRVSDRNRDFTAFLSDYLNGFPVIRSFRAEDEINQRFASENHRLEQQKCTRLKLQTLLESAGSFTGITAQLGIFLLGTWLALTGRGVTPGVVIAFVNLMNFIIEPIAALPGLLAARKAALALVQKLGDSLAGQTAQPGGQPLPQLMQQIELEHAGYRYTPGKPVLQDLSATLKAGKAYAVVGASGGGKSTLANLVCRFFDVQSGSVRVGGADVREIPKEELMDTISFVFQNSRLLKGSILDNVRLGRPQATEAEVLAALKAAQCMDIVEKFPAGIHTVIGTKGVYLSGGEQQRIAIARAMLKNVPILILDEATAFADPDNEAKVQAAFAQLAKGKTVLMIAHRLSTVANADCIYVVQDGQIAESGTKDELCAQNGLFARMWQEYQASVQWKVAKEG